VVIHHDGVVDRDRVRPESARDAAGFSALLRSLKKNSRRTLRQLEEEAARQGAVLPRSTVADMLRRDALPRPELLAVFVRACGDGQHLAEWLSARERLALSPRLDEERPERAELVAMVPPGGDVPAPPPPRRPKRWLLAAAAASTVAAVTAVLINGPFDSSASPADECTAVLSNGNRGLCVVEVQEQLHQAGFRMPVDGTFGPYTKMRVVAFQVFANLPTTGMVDGRTRDALAGGGTRVSTRAPEQVEDLVRGAFPEEPGRAVDLVRCLSHADPLWTTGKPGGTREWGLFQLTDEELLFDFRVDYATALDTEWNIRAARTLWQRHGFARWTCLADR
jgi:hypothetical protein